MTVYGFVGLAASGKTTAANLMKEMFDGYIYSFAKPVKELAQELGLEPCRENYQLVGDKVRSVLGDEVWTQYLVKRILGHIEVGENVYVDDVRYLNEINVLKRFKAEIIYVYTPHDLCWLRSNERNKNGESYETVGDYMKMISNAKSERLSNHLHTTVKYGEAFKHIVTDVIKNDESIDMLKFNLAEMYFDRTKFNKPVIESNPATGVIQ